jgi:hypothetical protein
MGSEQHFRARQNVTIMTCGTLSSHRVTCRITATHLMSVRTQSARRSVYLRPAGHPDSPGDACCRPRFVFSRRVSIRGAVELRLAVWPWDCVGSHHDAPKVAVPEDHDRIVPANVRGRSGAILQTRLPRHSRDRLKRRDAVQNSTSEGSSRLERQSRSSEPRSRIAAHDLVAIAMNMASERSVATAVAYVQPSTVIIGPCRCPSR